MLLGVLGLIVVYQSGFQQLTLSLPIETHWAPPNCSTDLPEFFSGFPLLLLQVPGGFR